MERQIAEKALRALNGAGFPAYFVGGCVRDGLLGLPVKDWDVATVLRRLGAFSRQERKRIVWLCANHMRAHNLGSMSRPKKAMLLRHEAAHDLLALLWADTYGKAPFTGDRLLKAFQAAEAFYANDRLLSDLDLSAKTLLELGEVPGKRLGAKLAMMGALLDKDPSRTREDLLRAVGY